MSLADQIRMDTLKELIRRIIGRVETDHLTPENAIEEIKTLVNKD